MANIIGFAGLGVGALAFLFSILACALPYWQTEDTNEINIGLWRFCFTTGGVETCDDVKEAPDYDEMETAFKATQAMAILGLLTIVGGVVVIALSLFVIKISMVGFAAGGVLLAGGLFQMIAMAIFVADIADEDYDYSGAFALNILAWITAWAAGGIVVFSAIKGGDGEGEVEQSA